MARSSDGLRHPLTVGALVALLVNDLVLKGSGLVPGWLTGKLSDFAWLIVAPVALATLFGVRSRRGHAAIVAGFVALMVSTELSQAAADGVASLARGVGIAARLWADPTDLIALSVLPITWHLLARPDEPARRTVASNVLLGVAIFASIATSALPRPPQWTTTAYFVNRTSLPVTVVVRPTLAELDCTTLETTDLSAAASPDIFETGLTFEVAPNATAPLDRSGGLGGVGRGERPCDLVLLSIDGVRDVVVRLPGAAGSIPRALDGESTGSLDDDVEVALVLEAGVLSLETGSDLRVAPADAGTPVTTCMPEPDFEHGTAPGFGEVTILSITPGLGDCMSVALAPSDPGAPESLSVCVPAPLFPWVAGDVVEVADFGDALEITSAIGELRIETVVADEVVLDFRDHLSVRAMRRLCAGARHACGAFTFLRATEVRDATGPIRPGADGLFRPAGDTPRLLAIGLVEETVVAPVDCDDAHTSVATRMTTALFIE